MKKLLFISGILFAVTTNVYASVRLSNQDDQPYALSCECQGSGASSVSANTNTDLGTGPCTVTVKATGSSATATDGETLVIKNGKISS